MKVRSLIERKGGSTVSLGKLNYRFVPTEEGGPHYCDVENEGDVDTFLAIPEAYELLDPEEHADYIEQQALEQAERVANEARAIATAKRQAADKALEVRQQSKSSGKEARKKTVRKATLSAKASVSPAMQEDDKPDIPDLTGI